MNIAVILAGGIGNRLGNNIPKQFLKIAGKTVMEMSIEVFENNAQIHEIAIVIHKAYTSVIEEMVSANNWKKVRKILQGGSERYESSFAAICAYSDYPQANLIFHDAVRPLLNNRIINDVVDALKKYNAVTVAIKTTDTIGKIDKSGTFVENIPDRNFLYRIQTPQGFKTAIIKKAYDIALKDPHVESTDDCGIVAKYLPNEKVYVVIGEEANMKLTYKEDYYLLDTLFQLQSATEVVCCR